MGNAVPHSLTHSLTRSLTCPHLTSTRLTHSPHSPHSLPEPVKWSTTTYRPVHYHGHRRLAHFQDEQALAQVDNQASAAQRVDWTSLFTRLDDASSPISQYMHSLPGSPSLALPSAATTGRTCLQISLMYACWPRASTKRSKHTTALEPAPDRSLDPSHHSSLAATSCNASRRSTTRTNTNLRRGEEAALAAIFGEQVVQVVGKVGGALTINADEILVRA